MLTSIDYEGTQKGFDMDLIKKVIDKIKVPLIISGGCGEYEHVSSLKKKFKNVSVALASALHYNNINIKKLKEIIE